MIKPVFKRQGPNAGTSKPDGTDSQPTSVQATGTQNDVQELHKLLLAVQKEQKSSTKAIQAKIDQVSKDLNENMQKEIKSLHDAVSTQVGKLNKRLDNLEKRVSTLERDQTVCEPFPVEVSVVAFKVLYSQGEDIRATMEHLVCDKKDGLGLTDVHIVKVEQTPMRENRHGIVKIELKNLEDKKFYGQSPA